MLPCGFLKNAFHVSKFCTLLKNMLQATNENVSARQLGDRELWATYPS